MIETSNSLSLQVMFEFHPPTLKSTPIVALLSSSGNHCSSENRSKRLLFPTEELPISRSLTLIVDEDPVGAMDDEGRRDAYDGAHAASAYLILSNCILKDASPTFSLYFEG